MRSSGRRGGPASGTPLASLTTDANGFYQWPYKYTGKAATFTVYLPGYPKAGNGSQVPANNPQTVTLKSNGFLYVPFSVPGP